MRREAIKSGLGEGEEGHTVQGNIVLSLGRIKKPVDISGHGFNLVEDSDVFFSCVLLCQCKNQSGLKTEFTQEFDSIKKFISWDVK